MLPVLWIGLVMYIFVPMCSIILKICWIMWIVVLIHWSSVVLLQFDAPHNWLPLVPISNGVVLVPIWMQFLAVLVMPGAHAFIQTGHPLNFTHSDHWMCQAFDRHWELIHKWGRILVSVGDCWSDLKEAHFLIYLLSQKGALFCLLIGFPGHQSLWSATSSKQAMKNWQPSQV